MKRKESTPGNMSYSAIPILAFFLALWGGLTIVSSQSAAAQPIWLAGKQLLYLCSGMALMGLAALLPFEKHLRWTAGYAATGLICIFALPWLGIRINGMQGWYAIGPFFFQPSELGKAFFLLWMAKVAAMPTSDWGRFLRLGGITALWVLPILLQPDFGTAVVYLGCGGALYLLAGGSWKKFFIGATAGLIAAALFIASRPYALRRILAFLDPELDPSGSGWHIRQFQLAIAHGHWFGAKLGQAVWSNAHLPLAYNDSAYATMAETLGFLGALPVVVFYSLLYYYLLSAAQEPHRQEVSRLYLAGTGVLLALQALLHMSVNVGLLPPTGLTLPLVSYGGSSMVGTLLMLGIAISAARSSRSQGK